MIAFSTLAAGIESGPGRSARGMRTWALRRWRLSAFWQVQAAVGAVTALHYYLEATGYWSVFEQTVVILYVAPIIYAALRFGREGGVATSAWVVLLTVPDIFVFHRDHYAWVEDVIPTWVLVTVGLVLSARVDGETRQRRLAETLAERYRGLFERAGDGILLFDAAGRAVIANPATCSLLGRSLPELQASTARALLGENAADNLARVLRERDPSETTPGMDCMVTLIAGATHRSLQVTWSLVDDGAGRVVAQAMLRDVTVQRAREETLRAYAQQVTQAQEKERQRIARELHDDVAQLLVALCQDLDRLSVSGVATPTGTQDARERAMAALDAVRRFARDLRPTMLDDLGLVPAIHWLVSDLGRRQNLKTELHVAGNARRLPDDVEITLFRVVQEALRNVERHARASNAVVEIHFGETGVEAAIQDDGRGFEPPHSLRALAGSGHLGLLGVQERIRLIGGTLRVVSSPGDGVRLTVSVPDSSGRGAAGPLSQGSS